MTISTINFYNSRTGTIMPKATGEGLHPLHTTPSHHVQLYRARPQRSISHITTMRVLLQEKFYINMKRHSFMTCEVVLILLTHIRCVKPHLAIFDLSLLNYKKLVVSIRIMVK